MSAASSEIPGSCREFRRPSIRLSIVDPLPTTGESSAGGSVADLWIVGNKSADSLSSPAVVETKVVSAKPGQLSPLPTTSRNGGNT